MRITVLEESQTTHLVTYNIDVDTLEEGINGIKSLERSIFSKFTLINNISLIRVNKDICN